MQAAISELAALVRAAERIAFLGGAGLSTESGIADFRSEDGIFRALSEYGAAPETLLSRRFFDQNPAVFFDYYRKYLLCPDAKPNAAHRALAALEQSGAAQAVPACAPAPATKNTAFTEPAPAGVGQRGGAARGARGRLTAVITQNIDDLHRQAGSKTVLELHGSVYRNHCMRCDAFYSLDALQRKMAASQDGVPRCGCGGIIKPDVVLYGENLDQGVLSAAVDHIAKADLLIIGGTSLAVYPAAGLCDVFRGRDIAVINLSEPMRETGASLTIRKPIGAVMTALMQALGEPL